MNPKCPEPNCKRFLRLRKLLSSIGISACPMCKKYGAKPYILTEKKKGQYRCSNCHADFVPKRREGFSRFWICKDHPWQKFKVGQDVIMCREKLRTAKEIQRDVAEKVPFKAQKKRQPRNAKMRPRT